MISTNDLQGYQFFENTNFLFDDDTFEIQFVKWKELENTVHSIDLPSNTLAFNRNLNRMFFPKDKIYEQLAITFYETTDFVIRNKLIQIQNQLYNDQGKGGVNARANPGRGFGATLEYFDNVASDIYITHKQSGNKFHFYETLPINIGTIKMDSSSEGNIILLTIPFMYTTMEFINART